MEMCVINKCNMLDFTKTTIFANNLYLMALALSIFTQITINARISKPSRP